MSGQLLPKDLLQDLKKHDPAERAEAMLAEKKAEDGTPTPDGLTLGGRITAEQMRGFQDAFTEQRFSGGITGTVGNYRVWPVPGSVQMIDSGDSIQYAMSAGQSQSLQNIHNGTTPLAMQQRSQTSAMPLQNALGIGYTQKHGGLK